MKDCPQFTCRECDEKGHYAKNCTASQCKRCNEVKKRRRCEQEEATENVDAELEDENKKEQILMITKSCGKEIEVELVDIREDLNGIQLQEETNDIEEEEELMMLEETIDETRSKNRTTQAMENVEEKEEEAEKKEGMVKKGTHGVSKTGMGLKRVCKMKNKIEMDIEAVLKRQKIRRDALKEKKKKKGGREKKRRQKCRNV